jgi:hypothetical protein
MAALLTGSLSPIYFGVRTAIELKTIYDSTYSVYVIGSGYVASRLANHFIVCPGVTRLYEISITPPLGISSLRRLSWITTVECLEIHDPIASDAEIAEQIDRIQSLRVLTLTTPKAGERTAAAISRHARLEYLDLVSANQIAPRSLVMLSGGMSLRGLTMPPGISFETAKEILSKTQTHLLNFPALSLTADQHVELTRSADKRRIFLSVNYLPQIPKTTEPEAANSEKSNREQ